MQLSGRVGLSTNYRPCNRASIDLRPPRGGQHRAARGIRGKAGTRRAPEARNCPYRCVPDGPPRPSEERHRPSERPSFNMHGPSRCMRFERLRFQTGSSELFMTSSMRLHQTFRLVYKLARFSFANGSEPFANDVYGVRNFVCKLLCRKISMQISMCRRRSVIQ